jgi:hypothetical protein
MFSGLLLFMDVGERGLQNFSFFMVVRYERGLQSLGFLHVVGSIYKPSRQS